MSPKQTPKERRVLYIIYQEDRDDGADIRAANKDAHFAYLDRHQDILVLGGALLADDGIKRLGKLPHPQRAEPRPSGGILARRTVPQGRPVQEREDHAHATRPMESGGSPEDGGGELAPLAKSGCRFSRSSLADLSHQRLLCGGYPVEPPGAAAARCRARRHAQCDRRKGCRCRDGAGWSARRG